jgi:hypothetical protein
VGFIACGDDATSIDAGGGSDAGARSDAGTADGGSRSDAGADAGIADAGPAICELECPENYACIDGDCINTCGSDAEALRSVIAPHLEVLFGFCDQGAFAHAVPRDTLYEVHHSDGRLRFGYRVDTGSPLTEVFAVTPAVPEGATLIGSPRLEMGHSAPVLFGVSTDEPGAPGTLYFTAAAFTGMPVIGQIAVPAHRDFALILGGDTYVVAGDGLGDANEGAGVYLGSLSGAAPRLVLTNAGDARSVIVAFEYLIVGADSPEHGWPDGGDGPRAFIVPLGMLAGEPLDALGDPSVTRVGVPSAELADLGTFGVAAITRNTHTGELTVDVFGLELYPEPGLSAPLRWVTGPGFDRFAKAGYGVVLFHHANGTWTVRPRE